MLRASDANGQPDTSPITVTTGDGGLLRTPAGTGTGVEGEISGDPAENGELDFDYVCNANADTSIAFTATNGNASAAGRLIGESRYQMHHLGRILQGLAPRPSRSKDPDAAAKKPRRRRSRIVYG